MEVKAFMHVGRFKDIVLILLKYGFDDVVDRLDFPAKSLLERIHPIDTQMSTWERIRRALEDLGPTFVKFGQMLSLRPDLLPYALIIELRRLQDNVAPVPFDAIRQLVADNLKKPLEDVFIHFDQVPMAAASMAQVHRGVLRDTRQVVAVKVQRPHIRQIIAKDLYILEAIARELHERSEDLRIYTLPKLVRELKRTMFRELDFTLEARNIKIVAANFRDDPEVRMPAVFEAYCTRQMLTMELIRGTRLQDLVAAGTVDGKELARRGIRVIVKQILLDGFFHADPHPGNILVQENGVLCLLDWGMVGRLTRETRFQLIDLISAIVEKDSERVMEILIQLSQRTTVPNEAYLQREILDILDVYHSVSLKHLDLGQLLLELTGLLREHRLQLPTDLAVMIRALVTAEGTARQIYPDLNVVEEAEGYVKALAMERWKPAEIMRNLRRTLRHMGVLYRQLPMRVSQIVEKVERGELSVHFQHENLGDFRRSIENSSNRLTLGIIIAAMIIGSSMVITTGVEPFLFGFPAFGILGYMISGVLGLWLVFNIIRSRKY